MISFPWDSIVEGFDEETGFPKYDRGYTAEQLREVLKTFFSNGIFADSPEGFVPRASSGMSIVVSAGRCFIQGDVGVEKSARTMVLNASTTQPRYDTIVLRWDNNIEARNIDLYVKQGTASSNPKRPTLTRGETVWELGLCDIFIPANSTSITQDRITDTRLDTTRCGIVNPFSIINTTTFFDQLQAAVDRAVQLAESAIDGTLYGKLEDDIQVTGINLARGTRRFNTGVKNYFPDQIRTYTDGFDYYETSDCIQTPDDEDGFKVLMMKYIKADYDKGNQWLLNGLGSSHVEIGDTRTFTVSFDFKYDTYGNSNSVFAETSLNKNNGSMQVYQASFSISDIPNVTQAKGKWVRLSKTFTLLDSDIKDYKTLTLRFRVHEGDTFYFRKLKIERGKAHNPIWSDSPFDFPKVLTFLTEFYYTTSAMAVGGSLAPTFVYNIGDIDPSIYTVVSARVANSTGDGSKFAVKNFYVSNGAFRATIVNIGASSAAANSGVVVQFYAVRNDAVLRI